MFTTFALGRSKYLSSVFWSKCPKLVFGLNFMLTFFFFFTNVNTYLRGVLWFALKVANWQPFLFTISFVSLYLKANHNKDYSVVKTFKAAQVAFSFTHLLNKEFNIHSFLSLTFPLPDSSHTSSYRCHYPLPVPTVPAAFRFNQGQSTTMKI